MSELLHNLHLLQQVVHRLGCGVEALCQSEEGLVQGVFEGEPVHLTWREASASQALAADILPLIEHALISPLVYGGACLWITRRKEAEITEPIVAMASLHARLHRFRALVSLRLGESWWPQIRPKLYAALPNVALEDPDVLDWLERLPSLPTVVCPGADFRRPIQNWRNLQLRPAAMALLSLQTTDLEGARRVYNNSHPRGIRGAHLSDCFVLHLVLSGERTSEPLPAWAEELLRLL